MVMEGWFRVIDRIEHISMNNYRGKGLGTNVGVGMLTAQAYADDQVLLFRAESAKKLECMFRTVWEELNVWANDVAVQYSAGKTEALFLPARGKIRPPVLTAGNLRIIPSAVVTYLGVVLDAKLLFLEHAKSVRVKVGTVCVKIKGKEVVWLMYERAVKNAILYASEIWGGKALDSRVKKQLEASHRLLLLGMRRVSKFYNEYDCRVNEGRAKESERVHPHQRITEVACGESPHVEEVNWQVWCDASVEGEKGAIGVWCVGTTTGEEVRDEWVKWGGKDRTSMEVAAIGKALGNLRSLYKEREGAVRLLHDLRDSGIRVSIYWEDRRGSAGAVAADKIASGALWGTPGTEMVATITKRQVRSLMRSWVLEEWQRLWSNSSKGRELFEVCDMVGKGMLGAETAQHVRTMCMKPVREAARESFDPETPRWRLRGINGRRDEGMVKMFEEFAEVVLSDDDFE
uniref:Reverse transcriptase domain-containing protein n=1 Tax=Dendroctonus ponderosae TaxID=77166 RepID=A0AAR5QFG6_DENPD